ncbi:hypothetical protein BACPLE_01746 [Phocaeicola plebeius DSM 17135]|uniref:Uncharacterized protein n=1 Tax=Phocaeicola plebeius (strain DSM 17135 / JCM 12973 / CCUG 54634 / M2) TaxID=484018 RepID=B5CYE9_PHOPM|nr:hypothetical protein BACPLE_01746 [Phocaeicola plebeius DSM 17135]
MKKFSQIQHFIIKPLIITPFLKMLYLPEMKVQIQFIWIFF